MTKIGLNLNDFFKKHRINLNDIHNVICDNVGLQPGEIAFLSGSLLDGLGTYWSDLDIYLLTERNLESIGIGPIIPLSCGSAVIDLEHWSLKYVEELIARLESMPANQDRSPGEALTFSITERELLHRLLIGQPLTERTTFNSLRTRINPLALSRIIFDRSVVRIGTAQVDLLGLFEDNDVQSALFLSQTLLGFTVDALLSATGNTNPAEKWRLRKLRQLDQTDWHRNFPRYLFNIPIAEYFFTLHNSRSLESEDLKDYSYQCIRFANCVVPWGQRRFLDASVELIKNNNRNADSSLLKDAVNSDLLRNINTEEFTSFYYEQVSGAKRISLSESSSSVLPRLSFNIQIRFQNNKLCIFSIRGGSIFEIGSIAHQALLLFDGKTCKYQAIKKLLPYTSASENELAKSLEDLQLFLTFHGFLDVD